MKQIQDFYDDVIKETGIDSDEVKVVMRATFKTLREYILAGEDITIPRIGCFTRKKRKERERNILVSKSGKHQLLLYPAHEIPYFDFSKPIDAQVRNSSEQRREGVIYYDEARQPVKN